MRRATVLVLWAAVTMHSQVTGRVTGRVTAERGTGTLRAQVTAVVSDNGVRISTANTEETGAFTIDVRPGMVTIIARADGYVSEQRDLAVRPGNSNPHLEFSLAPAAAVSGRVFDQNGVGVPQARVWLQYHGESRAWQLAEEHGGEESDAFGNFVIPVVAQGRPFVLHAESEGWLLSTSRTMVIRGQELTGVSLLLSRRGGTISGQVVDSSGLGVSGVPVRLRAIAADTEFSEQQRQSIAFSRSMNRVTVSGPDGSYHFSGVPSGRAVVSADGLGRHVGVERDITTGRETRVDLRLP